MKIMPWELFNLARTVLGVGFVGVLGSGSGKSYFFRIERCMCMV